MDSDSHVQLAEVDFDANISDDIDHGETHVDGVDGFLDGLRLVRRSVHCA